MNTIDEFIKLHELKANAAKEADSCVKKPKKDSPFCMEAMTQVSYTAKEHEQIANWLKDLKSFQKKEVLQTTYQKLVEAFPGSFIKYERLEAVEFIAHKKANSYIVLSDCETKRDIECKILEWFAKDTFETKPYESEKSNNLYQAFMLKGINTFLDADFSEDDMELIHAHLGYHLNPEKTKEFLESNCDMHILDKNYDEREY